MSGARVSPAAVMLVAGLAVLPLVISNEYALSIITLTLLYAYLALAWNLIGGIAGQLSLGHAAYFGVGSYTSTLMFLHLGISPWLGMLVGAALAAVAALIIGLSCFRLRGAYFALATLAAAMIFKIVAENSQTALGGPGGLAVKLLRDAPLQFQHTRREFYYVVIVVLAAIAVLLNHAVLRSRLGHYLVAIRNDHDAARALGVDTTRCKLAALVLSAALTAVGGTFYAQFMLYISPDKVFGANLSVQIAVMCIIGGRATVWGPVLGALLLFSAEEGTRYLTGGTIGVDMMLYGLLLMAVIRLEPRGVYRSLQDARQRWMTRSRAGAH